MPIIGMTDKEARLPGIGQLRKGSPKGQNRPGRDLDYFRFTSDDQEALEAFAANYPSQPRQLRVLLPYQTGDENMQSWKESWTAGALQHRCDGQTTTLLLTRAGDYDTEPHPCPGDCKQVGRLTVILPELGRLATVTVLTTSIHDIINLTSQLRSYDLIRDDLRGVPFILQRKPKMVSVPLPDNKRTRLEKWLLSIEIAPDYVQKHLAQVEHLALPEPVMDHHTAPDVIESTAVALPDDITDPTSEPGLDEEPKEQPKEDETPRDPMTPADLAWAIQKRFEASTLRAKEDGKYYPAKYHPEWGKKTPGLVIKHLRAACKGIQGDNVYQTVLMYLASQDSATNLTAAMADVLIRWLLNGDWKAGFKGTVKAPVFEECALVYAEAIKMAPPPEQAQEPSDEPPPELEQIDFTGNLADDFPRGDDNPFDDMG